MPHSFIRYLLTDTLQRGALVSISIIDMFEMTFNGQAYCTAGFKQRLRNWENMTILYNLI